jgi:hypothetical protein
MPEGHQHFFERRGWTADYFLQKAAAIGTHTRSYIEGMLQANSLPNKPIMAAWAF